MSWISSDDIQSVTTWENFNQKTEYISSILKTFKWRRVVAIGDQEWDIISTIETNNIGLKIGSSGTKRILGILENTHPEELLMIGGWATGSLLYRVQWNIGRVIKAPGFWTKSIQEILGNIHGYESLHKLWAVSLLPSFLEFWNSHIEMSDLWSDLSSLIKKRQISIDDAIGWITWKMKNIIMGSTMKQGNENWAYDILDRIEQYKESFIELWYIEREEFNELIYLFTEKCKSYGNKNRKHNLMPLDFTPDNIFIEQGQPKFIDPWKQISYTGFTTISLAQFLTLLWIYEEIDTPKYELELLKLNDEFKGVFWSYADDELYAITSLGIILQCILSAKHRAIRKPEQSKFLFQKAILLIQKFIHV